MEIDGEPYFVGIDVAQRLGYVDTVNALKKHCKGVVKRHPLQTKGGIQDLRVIAEPEVYRLVIGSTLPAAERFERWVFKEVLPSIRRTGYCYSSGSRRWYSTDKLDRQSHQHDQTAALHCSVAP